MDPHSSVDRPIALSALQHWVFCKRQCGLIHLERVWADNLHTAEGNIAHRRVHQEGGRRRGAVRTVHGLEMACASLGLYGVADAVEFHGQGRGRPARPFPVEHKRGRAKSHDADKVQLCAQGLCLEEMTGLEVPAGALFYGATRKRLDVPFDAALRGRVAEVAGEVRQMLETGVLPPPELSAKCRTCSLRAQCMPDIVGRRSARRYLEHALEDAP